MSNALDLSLDFYRFSAVTTIRSAQGKALDHRSHFGVIVRGSSILQYAQFYQIGSVLIAQKLDVPSREQLRRGAHVVVNTSQGEYPNLSLRLFDSQNPHNTSLVKTLPQNKIRQTFSSSSVIGVIVAVAVDKAKSFL